MPRWDRWEPKVGGMHLASANPVAQFRTAPASRPRRPSLMNKEYLRAQGGSGEQPQSSSLSRELGDDENILLEEGQQAGDGIGKASKGGDGNAVPARPFFSEKSIREPNRSQLEQGRLG
jgi:hypothetical protein